MSEKHPGGRPPKYETVEELEKIIYEYFDECKKEKRPYTMSGLAYALGVDRRTLLNYSKDEIECCLNDLRDWKLRLSKAIHPPVQIYLLRHLNEFLYFSYRQRLVFLPLQYR